ncbi:poly(3-hydroxyalkanoate) depolymerase [Aurantivibrio plasticivorans]
MVEFEDSIIKVDRLKIRVVRKLVPDRTGPPLLLFNGIGANAELLKPLMEDLEPIECITFDIPGIGQSQGTLLPMRFKQLSRLAAKILDYFDYGNVDALGVSWGGGLAQDFARQHQTRCRRLILAATSPGVVMVPSKPSVFMKLSTPKRYLDEEYLMEVAHHIYGGVLRDEPERVQEFAEHIKTAKSGRGYLNQLAAVAGWTSIHWLHKLQQPTLILAGTDDPLVPLANGKILSARIPNSILVEIECGHLLLLTKREEVVPKILTFLQFE